MSIKNINNFRIIAECCDQESFMDYKRVYSSFAVGLRIWPEWHKHLVIKKDNETYFVLIAPDKYNTIESDLIIQGFEIIGRFEPPPTKREKE